MWYIKWKLLENSIQICQLNVHLTPYLTVSSQKWPKNCYFCWLFYWGGHVHIGRARRLNFGLDNGLDLYFHNPKQFLRGGGTLDPPRGGNHPKNWKNMFWVMWHINRKPIKSSIQICQFNAHLTTNLTVSSLNRLENRFFITFFSGEHVHTEWDKKLIFFMDIGSDLYFHIMNQNLPGMTRDPPRGGGVTTPKSKKHVLGHVTYQSKAHE